METDYFNYQRSLGNIPNFLFKYLNLPILVRLKDISLLCGMDYASKAMYDFKIYISRYDHSLNVALITWHLTNDKNATLAALFHDVASPVFSHVIDYMNGDYIKQESTEEKTAEILLSSFELRKCLVDDGIDINDILDFKKYSIVDLDRPKMCADRLDNIISVGMAWVGSLNYEDALKIINSVDKTINEDGEDEICFNDKDVALYVKEVNDIINKLTHTNEDNYMMNLVANMIKRCLELGLFNYDDLFIFTEHEVMDVIEKNLHLDTRLFMMWSLYKNILSVDKVEDIEIKNKTLEPLYKNKRI